MSDQGFKDRFSRFKQAAGKGSEASIKQRLTVDQELKALIPPLRSDEFEQLEENIRQEGCRDPLIIWNNGGEYTIIDGHNRHRICTKHKLDFKIEVKEFADKQAVKDWMILHQLGRRNLSPDQASYLRGMLYNSEKRRTAPNSKGYNRHTGKGEQGESTAERVAKQTNVSASTVKRDAKYAEGLEMIKDPSLKAKVLSGEVPITKEQMAKVAAHGEVKSKADLESAIKSKKKSLGSGVTPKLKAFLHAAGKKALYKALTDKYPDETQRLDAVIRLLEGEVGL